MAQQHQTPTPNSYGQGPGIYSPENDIFYLQEDSKPTSQSMDRGPSNNSINSTTSNNSSWTNVSWNASLTPASPMSSWEEVPYIKWEENTDAAEYSPEGSQGFQTPVFPPSSFADPAPIADTRPTPTSLGWSPDSPLLKLYKFVVTKQKDPYFELQEGYASSYQIPPRVYLDYPEYVPVPNPSQ